jgi:ankyrin repeat protein
MFKIFKLLIEYGENPTIENRLGSTLTNAAASGHVLIVKYLIEEYGMSINEQTKPKGWTPLIAASLSYNSRTEMVKYLLSKGADKSIRDNEGMTAIDYASQTSQKQIKKLLGE